MKLDIQSDSTKLGFCMPLQRLKRFQFPSFQDLFLKNKSNTLISGDQNTYSDNIIETILCNILFYKKEKYTLH